MTWMKNNLKVSWKITKWEIIFGIPMNNNPNVDVINYIVLIGKWFINKRRTEEAALYFLEYLTLLKQKIEVIVLNNKTQSRDNTEWQDKVYRVL